MTVQLRVLPACAALAVSGLIAYAPAAAQVVSGRVLEEGSGRAVQAASIELLDAELVTRAAAETDSLGRFHIDAPGAGTYRLRVSHLGYAQLESATIDVGAARRVMVELQLAPAALALEPLRVVGDVAVSAGWLEEFYERSARVRRSGTGRVFSRQDIERIRPNVASQMLIYLLPRGGCRPTLFVDGLEVAGPRELDAAIRPEVLEGVEFYNNAALLPPRYAAPGRCAVALFWTRRDTEDGRRLTWRRAALTLGLIGGFILIYR